MSNSVLVERPRMVTWLGYGGLIPFISLALLSFMDRGRGAFWHACLVAYGAVILSFVGALHWGFAMVLESISATQRDVLLAWSVVPCLIAFVALVVHSVFSDILLVIGFLMHVWQDRRLSASANLPAWYVPLRLRLSAVAIVCVAAGAVSV
jgi:hypothetical protein